MTFEQEIKHALNNMRNQMNGFRVHSENQQREIEQVIDNQNKLNQLVQELITKIDGDDKMDVSGLRKRVAYLESRDKWISNKWMYAIGAVGGITLVYAFLKGVDFVFSFYKNLVK